MYERVQLWCELCGLAAGAAGLVLIGAALGGVLGAGLALLPVAAVLLVLGNMTGGER
ncbi:hypothetical protein ACQEV4_40415 [Streptomyces shenzhenensis]|uniref:hypothetical protein n=1 Tax=Streptomyces shenzhenensis TaxID=943815 RepID=UPI003D8B788E